MLEGHDTGTIYSEDSHSLMIDDDASSVRRGSAMEVYRSVGPLVD